MDKHYSTLELVRYDETARAPERDYDTTAFELDSNALAPQVSKTWSLVFFFTDSVLRLYLKLRHKYSITFQLLKSTRRILVEKVLPASMSPSVRLNGHGRL